MAKRKPSGSNSSRRLILNRVSFWILGVIICCCCFATVVDSSMLRLLVGVQAAFLNERVSSLSRTGRISHALSRQSSGTTGVIHSPLSSRATPRMTSKRFLARPSAHLSYCRNQHQRWPTPALFSTSLTSTKRGDSHDSTASTSANNSYQDKVAEFLSRVEASLCEGILPQIESTVAPAVADNTENDNDTNSEISNHKPIVLLVAVSGGCDSMGLLHALLDTSNPVLAEHDATPSSRETGYPTRRFPNGQLCELHVAHFDHCQRGLESQKDSQLVQDICQQQGLPCHVYEWDTDMGSSPTSSESKFSQDKARQWRQSTLTQLLQDLTGGTSAETEEVSLTSRKGGVILTAHHANDSQETLLLKLLRGVHVQNLSGMSAIQFMEASNTFWARPMLDLTKDQIQSYLERQDYAWREDESNQSNKYLRNRVRNELIPLMQGMLPK